MTSQTVSDFENKIQEIITLTSDSNLLSYQFSNNILHIAIELENEEVLKIILHTFYLYGEDIRQNKHENTGVLQYKRLTDYLKVENGYYTIPEIFEEIMKLSRDKLSLAIGLKTNAVSHLLYFHGYNIKLAFLVNYDYKIEYKIE
jgi:hypothetical protein